MLELSTDRLDLRTMVDSDWPLFLRLHSEPQTMQYVFGEIAEEQVRQGFEHRLPAWGPQSEHWLCLVVTDRASGHELGVTGFRILSPGHARWVACCCRSIRAKASAPSREKRSSTTPPTSGWTRWSRP